MKIFKFGKKNIKAEARKRGFVKGAIFAPCDFERYMPQIEIEDPDKIIYNKEHDTLYYNGYAIYSEGFWGIILNNEGIKNEDN